MIHHSDFLKHLESDSVAAMLTQVGREHRPQQREKSDGAVEQAFRPPGAVRIRITPVSSAGISS